MKFSERQFTQPQLLAVLCLMRYEDWTFRKAEVRLSEHAELRSVLRPSSVPDYTTLYRFLLRLKEEDAARLLNKIVGRMPARWRSPTTVAIDAAGLAQSAVSSYFIRRVEHFGGKQRTWKHWLTWLAVVDVERQIILSQSARQAPWNDCATLPMLVGQASSSAHTCGLRAGRCRVRFRADHIFCRQQFRANSIIPTKRFTSRHVPGRNILTQSRQALLLGLAFNLCRLWPPVLA